MEGGLVDHAGQEVRVHLLVVELLHVVEAAVPAQLRHRTLGELPGVGFREDVGVEGAGHERHVDDAVLDGVADLEGRHRLRAADEVDAQAAFAVRLDLVHEGLETLHVGAGLDERRDRAQGRLLGRGARREHGRRRGDNQGSETRPHGGVLPRSSGGSCPARIGAAAADVAGEFSVTAACCQTGEPPRPPRVIPEAAQRLSGIHSAGGRAVGPGSSLRFGRDDPVHFDPARRGSYYAPP